MIIDKQREKLKKKVINALDALGPTERTVATRLRKAKIKGIPISCSRCPIAVYLSRIIKQIVDVTPHSVVIRHARLTVPSPWPVVEFIRRFDHGRHPSLEKR